MGSKSFLRLLVFVLVVGCLAVLLLSQTRQAAQAGNIPAQTAQAAGSGVTQGRRVLFPHHCPLRHLFED